MRLRLAAVTALGIDGTKLSTWHLGEDTEEPPTPRDATAFPSGDFRRLHRCAILAIESRAAQNDHEDIAKAAADPLLDELDKH